MIFADRLARLFAVFVLTTLTMSAAETSGTITFSEPVDGSTVGTTFHLLASGSADDRVYGITVYVNGIKTASSAGSVLDASLSGVSGRTRVTVQAFNRHGHFQKTIYVNATTPLASNSRAGSSASSSPTAAITPTSSSAGDAVSGGTLSTAFDRAKIFPNIERLPGWESCTVCAGPGGKGGVADHSMQPNEASPSLDGHAARFDLGGKAPYADALWWKQLGPDANAHHFVYDLYFYIDKPEVSQALEFDVNQSTGGKKYIFGTECSLRRGTWDVWAADRSWIRTTVPCGRPAANTWHHLVWEFERTQDDKVKYVSVTLDGVKHYVDQTYDPKPSHSQEINVAFQMDGNGQQNSYSVWLNKVQLSYW